MFTGIVQEVGNVIRTAKAGDGIQFSIEAPLSAAGLHVDDSVAVNGACLTVIEKMQSTFKTEAVAETLKKTTLGELQPSSQVNLELAMRLGDRVGGHLVLGHVDCIGTVRSIEERAGSWLFTFTIPEEFSQYVVPVGSIAIDGVSLTVAAIQGLDLVVSIIPHTMEKTTFARLAAGSKVNLEFDIIGKYIERLLTATTKGKPKDASAISLEKLTMWGYGTE
jgi:riboflavin synthase